MKQSLRVMSLILIAAALLGFAGGGAALRDVLGAKTYWEDKGA